MGEATQDIWNGTESGHYNRLFWNGSGSQRDRTDTWSGQQEPLSYDQDIHSGSICEILNIIGHEENN